MKARNAKMPEVLKSGRSGAWVYYVSNGKQCRRLYVVPKDPRTPSQLERRAAFGAASHAYSHSPELTEEERRAYRVAGKKVRSRPRLGQSGPLTGQLYYVARSCEKPERRRQKAERGMAAELFP
jgi:hypothetical protein